MHSHTRTCFGAAFNTPSSSGTVNRGKRTQNNHDDNSLHDDVNGDLAEVESSLTGDLPHSSSSQCISWSSDCSIRYSTQMIKYVWISLLHGTYGAVDSSEQFYFDHFIVYCEF